VRSLLAFRVRGDWNLPHSRARPKADTQFARPACAWPKAWDFPHDGPSFPRGASKPRPLSSTHRPTLHFITSTTPSLTSLPSLPSPPSPSHRPALAGLDHRHDATPRTKTIEPVPVKTPQAKMKRVFSFFYLLCVLAPLLDQEAAGWGRGVKAAETCAMATAYAPARPASLVLPTSQRPHVIAHRGGE
jgi:hypothetical protein